MTPPTPFTPPTPSQPLAELAAAVQHDVQARIGAGRVADYIPALAPVDPCQFGLAIQTCTGEQAAIGDCLVPFSVQSVSKVFTLTLALGRVGEALWQRVGREPSGSPFNSIVQLEREQGIRSGGRFSDRHAVCVSGPHAGRV